MIDVRVYSKTSVLLYFVSLVETIMSSIQQTKTRIEPVTKIIASLGRYNLLSQLQREVMIDDAISSIEYTPQDLETAYQQIMKTTQTSGDQELYNGCQQSYDAQKQIHASITRQLKIKKFKEVTWGQDISSYFVRRKKKLDKIVYSKIAHEDADVATEIFFRIREKEKSFAQLALEYPQDPEVHVNRIYDPIKVCSTDSKIAQLLLKIQPGEVLPPINCSDMFVVMRFEKIIPAVLDEGMRCRLLDELFENWLNERCNSEHYRKMMLHELNSWVA